MNKFVFKGTLGYYRRLLKTMMVVFENDHTMFHRFRLEASGVMRKRDY